MADKKSKVQDQTTGHQASWVTGNSGLTGRAAKTLSNRGNAIDAAVDAAVSGSSSGIKPVKQKKGSWPWQSK